MLVNNTGRSANMAHRSEEAPPSPVPYISWILEKGRPRVLGVFDRLFASTGMVNHHSLRQFEKIVGSLNAEVALEQYYREQAKTTKTRAS